MSNTKYFNMRSLCKAVTYRFLGASTTFCVAFIATGSIQTAAAAGVLDSVVKIVGYYVHERVWDKFR